MKTNSTKIGAALLAIGICVCCSDLRAQTTTTVTTTRGAFTEFVPASKTVVVRTEASAPLRYVVTKETTIVDETGAPVTVERIAPGSPLSVEYTGTGENLVASRIVVQRPAAVAAPVTTTTTTAPVTTTTAPVTTTTVPVATEQHITTTTATTHTLTHDEKEALKEQKEKQIEKRKEALDKAKDKLEDDDD